MLTRKPRFYQMAIRLMERETFQLYQKAAQRLGYLEQDIQGQFRPLLCLMIWAQKPLQALTLDDLNTFAQALREACVGLAIKCRLRHGLPHRWDSRLTSVQKVLYHMGVFPQLTRSTRRNGFDRQWRNVPTEIAASVQRYLRQMSLSLRPESAYPEKTR